MDIHGYESRCWEGRLGPNKTREKIAWASLNTILFFYTGAYILRP
jgi:hypothetical protein